MTSRDEPQKTLKITSVSVDDAARILTLASRRRVTAGQVREVVENGDLARADGTFSLIDYVAFLVREVTHG